MPSTIVLKRRITSIRSTRQITKAMELVSASKLRRAQAAAMSSHDYRELAYELLQRLSAMSEAMNHPLFEQRTVRNRLYILITSNSGLAGAYNANANKQLLNGVARDQAAGIKSSVLVIGSKGAQFVRRLQGVKLLAVYQPFGNQPTADSIRPLLNSSIETYLANEADSIELIYTSFISIINQKAIILPLLPVAAPESSRGGSLITTFEPDVETVIKQVATRLIEAQLWQGVLESLASEHAMRMMATRNATDNANDLIGDYTLELNTARQAAITQELAEITGGAEALNG